MAQSTSDNFSTASVAVSELQIPVAAATTIYGGSVVCVNSSGYAVPASDTSGLRMIGIAKAQADNSGGAAAAVDVRVEPLENMKFLELDAVSPTDVWNNQLVYFTDDHTVALVASVSNNVLAGVCKQVNNTTTTGRVLVSLLHRN